MRITRSYSIEDIAGFDIANSEVIVEAAAARTVIFEEDVGLSGVESLVIFEDRLKTAYKLLGFIFKGRVFAELVVEAEALILVFEDLNEVVFNVGIDRNFEVHMFSPLFNFVYVYIITNLLKKLTRKFCGIRYLQSQEIHNHRNP